MNTEITHAMNRIKIAILLAAVTALLTYCKDDNPLSQRDKATRTLAVTWGDATVLSAPVAGADGTLEDLTLTFAFTGHFEPAAFTATGAPAFFTTAANSTWGWENDDTLTEITLLNVSPVQAFTIEDLTAEALTIRFSLDGPIGGRVGGVGEYRIKLIRQ